MATGAPESRRLKAALALAGMSAADLADVVENEIQAGRRTIERVMQGKRVLKPWERERIAEALAVPVWFLTDGLPAHGRPVEDSAISERLEAIEHQLEELLERLPARAGSALETAARAREDAELAESRVRGGAEGSSLARGRENA
jgi:transcriptional regulator with XRE-family HTH domain